MLRRTAPGKRVGHSRSVDRYPRYLLGVFQCLIFDLDLTLAGTIPVCIAAFRSAFERFSDRRWDEEEIKALFGPTEEGSCRRVVPDHWQGCLEAYLDAYEKSHMSLTEPFPGIIDALGLLRERGVDTAVVTGKGLVSALISLRQLGLEPYFGVVETGSPDGPVKPESLRKVLARWGMEPHEAAYLGDGTYDMKAAAQVGMIALGAGWGEGSSVHKAHPKILKVVFDDVGAFTNWLETHVS
jgi:pyrophosphatase PpaX